jgi:MFS family permease
LLRGDSYRDVLANRSYRALWLGQSLSYLGQSIIYVLVALYVYELTGSAREVSFAVALELLPLVVIGPLAGVLADRLERKGILVVSFMAQAGLVGLLPFTTSLRQLYLLVLLSSLFALVTGLVWAAALPAITGQKLFVRGSSLDIVAYNAANVAGPVLGGWLASLVGARSVFFVVVSCFLGAALLSMRARAPGPMVAQRGPLSLSVMRSEFAEGMSFLAGHPILRYLVALNCIASFGWAASSVAGLVYLSEVLGLGGQEYGVLRGTVAMSIALGVYILGRYSRYLSRQHLLIGGVILAGVAYMAMLGEPELAPLLGLWFVGGLGWAAFWLMDESWWAEVTPDRLRGRAYSLADAIVSLAEVVTALLGGWLVTVLGPSQALFFIGLTIASGSIGLTVVVRLGYRWPRRRREGGPE